MRFDSKNCVSGALFFIVYACPALFGIIPDKILLPYLGIGAVFSLLLFKASDGSRILKNLAALIASLGFSLVALDVLMRLFFTALIYPRPEDEFLSRWPAMPDISLFSPNVNVRRTVFGDLAGLSGKREYQEVRNVIFETDEFGYRNTKGTSRHPIDVIIVGDSVGAGMDTSQEKIWPALLFSQYGLRTYNVSTGGCPWDYLMNVKVQFNKIQTNPAGATLCFVVSASNDLVGRYNEWTEARLNGLWDRMKVAYSTFRERSPFRLLIKKIVYSRFAKADIPDSLVIKTFLDKKPVLFLKLFADLQKISHEEVLRHKNYPHLKEVLLELRRFLEDKKIRVAVIVMPPKEDVYSWLYYDRAPWTSGREETGLARAIREVCQTAGFVFIDAKPFMIEESEKLFKKSGHLLWWRDDAHLNDDGNEAFARLVYQKLFNNQDHKITS